jgi:hypothetical protein
MDTYSKGGTFRGSTNTRHVQRPEFDHPSMSVDGKAVKETAAAGGCLKIRLTATT